jgi:hypothetical protein
VLSCWKSRSPTELTGSKVISFSSFPEPLRARLGRRSDHPNGRLHSAADHKYKTQGLLGGEREMGARFGGQGRDPRGKGQSGEVK